MPGFSLSQLGECASRALLYLQIKGLGSTVQLVFTNFAVVIQGVLRQSTCIYELHSCRDTASPDFLLEIEDISLRGIFLRIET